MQTKEKVLLTNSSISFNVTSTESVQLQPIDIEPGFIAVSSIWPNGNDPVGNGNNVFVWLNNSSTSVPWGQQPIASSAVTGQSVAVTGTFGANQYVVGFSDGPAVTVNGVVTYPNICATAAIPSNWDLNNCKIESSSVVPGTVQASMVTANYAFTSGFNPNTSGSWVGLFAGNVTPYKNLTNLIGFGGISANTSSGSAVIANVIVAPNQPYTLVLFNTGYNATQSKLVLTSVAAVAVFQTGASIM